jgi:uncharacterized protein YuzE
MRWTYSSDADALYISIASGPIARTVELDPGTQVDVAADGSVVGIEILAPSRRWPLDRLVEDFAISPDDELMLRATSLPNRVPVGRELQPAEVRPQDSPSLVGVSLRWT